MPQLSTNLLLDSLDRDDRTALAAQLQEITLSIGTRWNAVNGTPARVCFPGTLVASIGEGGDGVIRCDTGVIGREGLIGWQVLLGAASMRSDAVVQLAGTAQVIAAADLAALCAARPTLHAALLRFIATFAVQLGHTAAAALRDPVERRLSRWLLMIHDRVDGDTVALTHGALAEALSVRRASVTDALHLLEGEGILRCTRGLVTIRDRAALERAAGSAYGPAEQCYRERVGPFGKGAV
jgi:CRP-like cAMP-binding protein